MPGLETNIGNHPLVTAKGQLCTEVNSLARCRHQNIVELMGVCLEPPALVYAFMPNGTLHIWLHSKNKRRPLKWNERCKVLKDVCRGLSWLHGIKPPVVHGDVKSQNVLLDANMKGKIGDFGFAKEMPQQSGRSFVTAAIAVRSAGYSAPELDSCQHSPKTDVYAYGVVTLECVTGQKAFSKNREDPLLVDMVDENLKSLELFKEITDPSLEELAPYLLRLLHQIVVLCFYKHRTRANSEDIMRLWSTTNF